MTAKLISIIGPPGVGKTTAAEYLERELPAELIREDYVGNPFLSEACTGRDEARLPSQLYFLISRVGQLSLARWPNDGLFVSDYGFCQDHIFAHTHLDEHELRMYERLASRFGGLVHPPDILIALDASEETLLERIRRRGRNFEKTMTEKFLSGMRKAYNDFIPTVNCPVICIDTEQVNLQQDQKQQELLAEIKDKL